MTKFLTFFVLACLSLHGLSQDQDLLTIDFSTTPATVMLPEHQKLLSTPKHFTEEAAKQAELDLDSTYAFSFDPATEFWERNGKTVYDYPSDNEETSITSNWNSQSNTWENDFYWSSFYDESTQTEDEIRQNWDAGTWVNSWRIIREWDVQDRLVRRSTLVWEANQWKGLSQYLVTYTGQGNDREFVYQDWNDSLNLWQNINKSVYGYNSFGGIEVLDTWTWDLQSLDWQPDARYTFQRDNDGTLTGYIIERYDPSTMTWGNLLKYIYGFNSQGQHSESIIMGWDGNLSLWVNNSRNLYSYDSHENRLSEIDQTWNDTLLSWRNYYQFLYAYDADDRIVDRATLIWENDQWTKLGRFTRLYNTYGEYEIITDYLQHPTTGDWLEDFKTEYYWTVYPSTSIADRFQNLHCAMPNPMQAGQPYSCTALEPGMRYELQVYDLSGRQLQHSNFQGSEGFSLHNNLPKGLYLIMISHSNTLLYRNKILVD